MSSYGKIATRGALWGLVGRGANEIIALPTSMIIARLLTPADFGIAAAVGFFIQIANRLTNFGFNTALIQLKTVEPRHSSSVFVLSLVTGVLAWLALLVSAPSLGRLFGSPEAAAALPIAGLTFVIGGVASVPSALMIRELRYRETAILDGLATAVVAFSGLAFALLGFSYWSLVYSQVLGALIPAIVRLRISGWSPAFEFSRSAIREMLSFGLGLHSKRLLDSAAQNLDNLLVGRALGIEALGFYDKAFSLMNRAVTLLSSGPAMSLRVLALIEHDGPRFRTAYCKLVMVSAFLAYSILAVMCLVAPELIRIMFGSQWDAAALPFQILCVTGALKLLNSYASSGLQATGRAWGEVGRQIAYLILIVAGVWLGRPYRARRRGRGCPGCHAYHDRLHARTLVSADTRGLDGSLARAIAWSDLHRRTCMRLIRAATSDCAGLRSVRCASVLAGCRPGFCSVSCALCSAQAFRRTRPRPS